MVAALLNKYLSNRWGVITPEFIADIPTLYNFSTYDNTYYNLTAVRSCGFLGGVD